MDRFDFLVASRVLGANDEDTCTPGACILVKGHDGACVPPHAEEWKTKYEGRDWSKEGDIIQVAQSNPMGE